MVIQATCVKGSSRGLQYQAKDKGQAEEICREGLYGDDPKDWDRQMREIEKLNDNVQDKRLSVVIAPSKEVSGKLTNADWEKLVDDYLKKEGINKGNVQYIAHKHNSTDDKHLHLIINRVDFNGKNQVQNHKIGERAGKHADEMCKERGWRTAKEVAQGRKADISQAIKEETAKSKNFEELSNNLHKRGYVLHLNYNSNGLNGARVIPVEDIKKENEPISRLEELANKGYKLSEIDRKLKIKDIENQLERNQSKSEIKELTKSPEQRISDIKDFRYKYEMALSNLRSKYEKAQSKIDLKEHFSSYKIEYSEKEISFKGEKYSSAEVNQFAKNSDYAVENAIRQYEFKKQTYNELMNQQPKEVPAKLNVFKAEERREALEYNERLERQKSSTKEPKIEVKITQPTALNIEMYRGHSQIENDLKTGKNQDYSKEESLNTHDKLFNRGYSDNEQSEEEAKRRKQSRNKGLGR